MKNLKISCGNLDVIELPFSTILGSEKRTIRIWTPEDYNSSDKNKLYPVIYMHDGQNIFRYLDDDRVMWEVNDSIQSLSSIGFEEAIIVGIDHGGVKRISELSPNVWASYGKNAPYVKNSCAEQYCDFLVNTVMPYINKNYNVKTGRKFTSICGSSMGGICSLYIGLTYNEIFGKVYAFSTAFNIYSKDFFVKYLADNPLPKNHLPYIYVCSGDTHGEKRKGYGGEEYKIAKFVPYIKEKLLASGYPREKIQTEILDNWPHHECTWRALFFSAFKWLESNYID